MKVFLDTTYLMPAIGISVKGIPPDLLRTIRENGHTTIISDLSLFELAAKGAKYISSGQLTQERVLKGIQAVGADDELRKEPIYTPERLTLSFKLRKMMNDYLDCAILSTAVYSGDCLLTEDSLIHRTFQERTFRKIIDEINSEFKLVSHSNLSAIES